MLTCIRVIKGKARTVAGSGEKSLLSDSGSDLWLQRKREKSANVIKGMATITNETKSAYRVLRFKFCSLTTFPRKNSPPGMFELACVGIVMSYRKDNTQPKGYETLYGEEWCCFILKRYQVFAQIDVHHVDFFPSPI